MNSKIPNRNNLQAGFHASAFCLFVILALCILLGCWPDNGRQKEIERVRAYGDALVQSQDELNELAFKLMVQNAYLKRHLEECLELLEKRIDAKGNDAIARSYSGSPFISVKEFDKHNILASPFAERKELDEISRKIRVKYTAQPNTVEYEVQGYLVGLPPRTFGLYRIEGYFESMMQLDQRMQQLNTVMALKINPE